MSSYEVLVEIERDDASTNRIGGAHGCTCTRTKTCRLHESVQTPQLRARSGPVLHRERKRLLMTEGTHRNEHPLNSIGAP